MPLSKRGIWCVIQGYPKIEHGVPRDELKNGCGCVLAVPYLGLRRNRRFTEISSPSLPEIQKKSQNLERRKWGFKRWAFKQIWGYLRKKAFFLRFLDFPGALRTLRKWVEKAEKGRKRPISVDFREGRPDTPSAPICYTSIRGSPKNESFLGVRNKVPENAQEAPQNVQFLVATIRVIGVNTWMWLEWLVNHSLVNLDSEYPKNLFGLILTSKGYLIFQVIWNNLRNTL